MLSDEVVAKPPDLVPPVLRVTKCSILENVKDGRELAQHLQ
jgi:hypothetical protein